MSGPLTTVRESWQLLRSIAAIDFHASNAATTPVTIDGTVYNPVVDVVDRRVARMRKQIATTNIAAAAATNLGTYSTGIPLAAGHLFLPGDRVTIASSDDGTYDGNFTLLGIDPTHIHIPVAYTAKTFTAGTVLGNRAIESIKTSLWPGLNGLEIRTRHTNATDTGTIHIFARRGQDVNVKLVATLTYAAGTQVAVDGTYFAASYAESANYWPKGFLMGTEEAGTGMASFYFDTMGWGEFWVACTVLTGVSAVTYVEYAGY